LGLIDWGVHVRGIVLGSFTWDATSASERSSEVCALWMEDLNLSRMEKLLRCRTMAGWPLDRAVHNY